MNSKNLGIHFDILFIYLFMTFDVTSHHRDLYVSPRQRYDMRAQTAWRGWLTISIQNAEFGHWESPRLPY